MILKNFDIVTIINKSSSIKNKKIPVKVGFAINRNLAILDPIASAYEDERRKIIDKYAEKDERGSPKISDGKYVLNDPENYKKDMKELLEMENEINFYTIPIDDLAKCDEDKFDSLTPDELEALYNMIE